MKKLTYIKILLGVTLCFLTSNLKAAPYKYVPTPKGSLVEVIKRTEISDYDKSDLIEQLKQTYPKAEILSEPTNLYNCHAYAWLINNGYKETGWMNHETLFGFRNIMFIEDGSYVSCNEEHVPANIVYYSDNEVTHSAAKDYPGVYITSKWGNLPLMKHTVEYCPYYDKNVKLSYYKSTYSINGGDDIILPYGEIGRETYSLNSSVSNQADIIWSVTNGAVITSGQGGQSVEIEFERSFSVKVSVSFPEITYNLGYKDVVVDNLALFEDIRIFQYGQTGLNYTLKGIVVEDSSIDELIGSCDDLRVKFSEIQYPDDAMFIDGPYLYKSVTFPESGSYNITLEGRLNGASVGQPFYKTISI